jgi:hypothetical protein
MAAELAAAVRRQGLEATTESMTALLEESEAMGVVERTGDAWKLTSRAERRYGQALRNLALGTDDERAAA